MRLIHTIPQTISKCDSYTNILGAVQNSSSENISYKVNGVYGGSKGALAYQLFHDLRKNDKNIIYITSTTHDGEKIYQDIKSMSRSPMVFYLPPWEILPYESISPFYDVVHHRIEVLHNLLSEEPLLLVTPVVNLMKVIIPKDIFKQEYLIFKIGKEINYDEVIHKLGELGYSREYKVEQPGTFTVKGGIIDIFPSSYEDPIRIELFDTEIESIRLFDSQTQLTKSKLDIAEILPQRELIITEDSKQQAIQNILDRYPDNPNTKQTIENIKNGNYFQGIEHLLPFFYQRNTLIDYLGESSIIIYEDMEQIKKRCDNLFKECQTLYHQSHKVNMIKAEPEELFDTFDIISERTKQYIDISSFSSANKDQSLFKFPFASSDSYSGELSLFKDSIKKKLDDNYRIIIFSSYEGQAHRLYTVLKDLNPMLDFEYDETANNNLKKSKSNKEFNFDQYSKGLFLGVSELSEGFSFDEQKIMIILDREIFNRKRTQYKKLRKVTSAPIESFYDLKKDDLIVHINYGIGKYIGIERIKALGKEKDFILLIYADDEKLYVPIEQLNMVQKYIGSQGKKAPLDKLGSKSWDRTKTRVRRSVEEIAEELVKIYSVRMKLNGYAYSKDTEWQHEFESGFQYEETPDQLTAIRDIKQDMESPRPTDRLICGDVGYGKTEVAIRAAFKAVMDGKQVAVLTPTTILCEQHYRTFKERFMLYPIKIDMLSRVRSAKEQREILKKLQDGELDLVIGTHRIVSKDVQFKNLGLVIIDEEQRFGVKHKEALKSLRTLVDVISMTATPIPRTLHMSLVKIRDMSIINTPPENRLPIETYVMEFNEEIIKDAIYRELERDGQIYFIYNRVQTIKSFVHYINQLVPEARVCMAHGQMDEHDLENIILEFINQKYNILISTTIIESGIDIPNVNTILIDRADSLGLSQLYQLRGRVGRGNRKGYCYLFYPQDKALSEIAQKRLAVINEYTDLGSGFKIAMKDMEFRGAGNVLGIEQSGSIVSVGFELYCKLLDEAVAELTTGEKQPDMDLYVDLKYDGYIPDTYIPDEKQKIELYKKMAGALSKGDIQIIQNEMIDRFGEPPDIIRNLLKLSEVKILARNIKIASIVEKGSEVAIEFNEYSIVNPEKIILICQKNKNTIRIRPDDNNRLYLKIADLPLNEKVHFLKDIITSLN